MNHYLGFPYRISHRIIPHSVVSSPAFDSMGIEQRFCTNHPNRSAIGVCVITKKPICGECSTRYNGVNYSVEGLQILRQREEAHARSSRYWLVWSLLGCITPLMFYLMYLSYSVAASCLISLLHRDKL